MSGVADIPIEEGVVDPRDTVVQILLHMHNNLNLQRTEWLEQSQDVRRYITGTSTSTSEVGNLPWKNKTVIPKLTQIADNLQSFYMAALMPDDDWFRWEGYDEESHEKANLIERYMQTKLKQGGFREELEKIVNDWVHYGTCYGGVRWVKDVHVSKITGKELVRFMGPQLYRISPLDALIEPHAKTFDDSIFITRNKMSISQFLQHNERSDLSDASKFDPDVVEKIKKMRTSAATGGQHDMIDYYKQEGMQIDGFSFPDWVASQEIELLEFWGDVYNPITGELQVNRLITIVDRSYVLRNTENPSWSGKKPFAHTGWRILSDNLYGQGPLDQIAGMQYRIDHLENLKADAFDQIVHPMIKIKGNAVDDFVFQPGGKIFVGDDGDVEFMRPDSSVLMANSEIAMYFSMMEEMAGSPRESAGFRTPGEKTAFEIDVLQQGADRNFQDKLNRFELFIQRILNIMFEMLIRNMDAPDIARVFNDDTKALELTKMTKEDVQADGILRPVGAKHFAARNKRIRELTTFLQVSATNVSIAPHISGIKTAEMFEQELGFEKFNLVSPNVAVIEKLNAEATALMHQQKLDAVMKAQGGEGIPEQQGQEPPEEME